MASTHMKIWLLLLIIRDVQVKTTRSESGCYGKDTKVTSDGEDAKLEPLLVGM